MGRDRMTPEEREHAVGEAAVEQRRRQNRTGCFALRLTAATRRQRHDTSDHGPGSRKPALLIGAGLEGEGGGAGRVSFKFR